MSNAGIPLRIIQEISGHRNLEQLQKYLEVQPDQVRGAVSALSTLSYVRKVKFPCLRLKSITTKSGYSICLVVARQSFVA